MLAKLLKHDFKSLFKYWWIAALVSLGLGIVAGRCFPIIISEPDIPVIFRITAVLALYVAFIGIGVFSMFSVVMIFIRFYKNLFTDEGYLTFTLPVKRASILNSKLISAVLFSFATNFVMFLSYFFAVVTGFWRYIFKQEFFENLGEMIDFISDELGAYFFVYCIEALLLLAALTTLSTLLLFVCITVASVITKKARLIIAIGIYYLASSVFASIAQVLSSFSLSSIAMKLATLSTGAQYPAVAGMLLCVIMLISVICGAMYITEYYMLDRKLNLL